MTLVREPAAVVSPPSSPLARVGAAGVVAGALALLLLLAGVHVTQGTSNVGLGDLLGLLTGDDPGTRDILVGSRVPRLAAGLVAGLALGAAGAVLQSVARNALASPDTLGITAGAALMVAASAAFGLSLPVWLSGLTAFVGGLAAAGLILALAAGSARATTRLVLAGSAVALALQSAAAALLILFEQETTGVYAWMQGQLAQAGLTASLQMAPVVVVGLAVTAVLARRLDLLGLGDDAATSLGVRPGPVRFAGIVVAAMLTAASVALCGPLGFVGLCAPTIVRLCARVVPPLARHAVAIPLSAITGACVVLAADVALRLLSGTEARVEVPTGVGTSFVGALFLVLLARGLREAGPTRRPAAFAPTPSRPGRRTVLVLVAAALLVPAAAIVGLLLGYNQLLLGDIGVWLAGDAPRAVMFQLDERAPRVGAALLAGAALALAGGLIQGVCRNPLAEPYTIGVTSGAGVGAVAATIFIPSVGIWGIAGSGFAGAAAAFAVVYLLALRGGAVDSDRILLIGIGIASAGTAVTTYLLVTQDPWNTPRALTWLSGTTYGRTSAELLPVVLALVVALFALPGLRREIDIVATDDDTPRIVGVALEPTRLTVLGLAVLLSATSVAAIGTVGFVGLVAPHIARSFVGGRATRYLPAAMAIGAVLVSIADTIGRTVIAPAQLPAGLVVAIIGAPYFVFLLYRSR